MKRIRKTYTLAQLASAVFMMAALLWLTMSIAFIYPAQQQLMKQGNTASAEACMSGEEDGCNPFGNTTEEKSSGNNISFSEEYLHNHHSADHFITIVSRIHNSRNCGTYNAFHGEVHVPPPNIA